MDRFISPQVCAFMKKYLSRAVPADGGKNAQAVGFLGAILPKGAKLYSKAGWVSSERHEVAYIVLPNGHEYVIAAFTKHHANDITLIQTLGREILTALGEHSN